MPAKVAEAKSEPMRTRKSSKKGIQKAFSGDIVEAFKMAGATNNINKKGQDNTSIPEQRDQTEYVCGFNKGGNFGGN